MSSAAGTGWFSASSNMLRTVFPKPRNETSHSESIPAPPSPESTPTRRPRRETAHAEHRRVEVLGRYRREDRRPLLHLPSIV